MGSVAESQCILFYCDQLSRAHRYRITDYLMNNEGCGEKGTYFLKITSYA